MARLKTEYGVDADYMPVPYTTARWIGCDDRKRLTAFEKEYRRNLARDAEGNLIYLAEGDWRLRFLMEDWPDIQLFKTREYR